MNQSDEIKSKLDIVEVIREYIQLRPAGMNFRALCPFHNEKSPSFLVSPEKQIFHCFGCGKGGDIFSFVMEMEGLSFPEALRQLADKAGVKLEKSDPKLSSRRNRLLDIVEFSRNYYSRAFLESKEAEAARQYIYGRQLDEKTVSEWRIGYSPNSWDDLYNFLKRNKFSDDEIFSAGMSVVKDGGSQFYNRFRGRIMFPINDISGHTVGFTARVMPGDEKTEKMGKYINSPQTLIYDKSRILFGLDKAKIDIKSADMAVVVEGQMDAISAHQAGFRNVVASSGTALTADQVKLLKRYSNKIAMAFDSDNAGVQAMLRAAKEALAAEMSVFTIIIPEGKDPDECIKKNPKEWEKAVKNPVPFLEHFFDKIFANADLRKTDEKRRVVAEAITVLRLVENKIEKDFWLRKIASKLDVPEEIIREYLGKQDRVEPKVKAKPLAPAPAAKAKTQEERFSEIFLALLFSFPSHVEYALDRVKADFLSVDIRPIYRQLAVYYNNEGRKLLLRNQNARAEFFKDFIDSISRDDNGLHDQVNRIALIGERDFYNLSEEEAAKEIWRLASLLKKQYLVARLKELEELIGEMEKNNESSQELEGILKEFRSMSEELKEISE